MKEFGKFIALTERNMKCYFKDKFLFFVSLITPLILLTLFATFLRSVYISSFKEILALFSFETDEKILNGLAGSWLLSSVVSVSAVTVAFCSNAVMIQDKLDGYANDFSVSPVKGTTVSLSYFAANFFVTLLVVFIAMFVGFIYLAIVGWYLSLKDMMMIFVGAVCCVLFGTLLAGVVESFVSSQGALSAVSTLISSLYGFICGAYMPLSQFSAGVRDFLCLLPGTYGVGIMRKAFMTGYLEELGARGLSEAGQKALLDGFDGNLYVGSAQVSLGVMYAILLGTCALLLAAYLVIVIVRSRRPQTLKRPKNSKRS